MRASPSNAGLAAMIAPVFSFTTFFAVLAWAVTNQVDRWIDSPTIEYHVSKKQIENENPPAWEIRANVVNLSHKNTFRNAKFLFVGRFDEKGIPLDTIFDVNEQHTEMIFHGPTLPEGKRSAKVQVPGAEFVVPVLAPGASVELVTRYVGKDEPRFVGAPAVDGSESFVLVEKSLVTYVVANEFWVMTVILAIWLLVIIAVAIRNSIGIANSENARHTNGAGAPSRG